jgi:hypothetical protein
MLFLDLAGNVRQYLKGSLCHVIPFVVQQWIDFSKFNASNFIG